MTPPTPTAIFDAIEETWPAAEVVNRAPWTLRRGLGGGSRVSAATAKSLATVDEIEIAEAAMQSWGQDPLFMLRPDDIALDRTLQALGYEIKDPVVIMAAPIDKVAKRRPETLSSFTVWPPVACQRRTWLKGGIGAPRLDVMERSKTAKTSLLGRRHDSPAGAGFVGVHGSIAMLHALEVEKPFRRTGLGRDMTVAAAFWALGHGAEWLMILVTRANKGAIALYSSIGMTVVGEYHYRIKI